jgi:hypothetical protein
MMRPPTYQNHVASAGEKTGWTGRYDTALNAAAQIQAE